MKQSKLRRRRVIRFAILYFVLLALFIGLVAGPIVAGSKIPPNTLAQLGKSASLGKFQLMQPNLSKDNTNGTEQTGTGRPGYTGAFTRSTTKSGASEATASPAAGNNRIKLL